MIAGELRVGDIGVEDDMVTSVVVTIYVNKNVPGMISVKWLSSYTDGRVRVEFTPHNVTDPLPRGFRVYRDGVKVHGADPDAFNFFA